MEPQWQGTRAGWLATRWQSIPPNPRWPTATSPSATRLATSSSTPTCTLHHTEHRSVAELFSDVTRASCRNNGSEFGGSIYQKVNDNLETAVNLAWTAGSNGTRFGIAAKYQLDSSASLSVSIYLTCYVRGFILPVKGEKKKSKCSLEIGRWWNPATVFFFFFPNSTFYFKRPRWTTQAW